MDENPNIPGYEVIKELGEGGMATVYLAIQQNFERKVALKIMATQFAEDDAWAQRFIREAKIVAQLNHQNIIPVYDVGVVNGCHYIAMEFLPQGDLRDKMKDGLELGECITITKGIAQGLNYAGSKGFIHRDIKPENILFREDGQPVISDFGIARPVESNTNMTQTGTVVGTPHYMSPEQAEALELDPRSDIYSLGIMFYELLTGSTPFHGDSAVTIGVKHITEEPPPLPDNLGMFQEFIDIALAKSPEDRFENGKEMAEFLADIEKDLGEVTSATLLISKEDIAKAKRTSQRTRSNDTRAKRQSTYSRPNQQKSGGKVAAIAVASTLALVAAGGGAWYFLKDDGQPKPKTVISQQQIAGLNSKSSEFIGKAESALAEGRLYQPDGNNAQHYLTTVLTLDNNNERAIALTRELINRYMANTQTALQENNVQAASNWLNQASQITFYIGDSDINTQLQDLRTQLIEKQQLSIFETEKQNQISDMLAMAQKQMADGKLTSPPGDNAYETYQNIFAIQANNPEARKGISDIASNYLGQARQAADNSEFAKARALVAASLQIDANHPQLAETQAYLQDKETAFQEQQISATASAEDRQRIMAEKKKALAEKIQGLIAGATADLEAGRLQSPEGNNAAEKFREVLSLDPTNLEALQGLEQTGERYIDLAKDAIAANKLDDAENFLKQARQLAPQSLRIDPVQQEIINIREQEKRKLAAEKMRQQQVADLLAEAETDIGQGRAWFPLGNNALEKLHNVKQIDPGNTAAAQKTTEQVDKLALRTQQLISQKQYDDAYKHLQVLNRYDSNTKRLASLRDKIKAGLGQSVAPAIVAESKPAPVAKPAAKPAISEAQQYVEDAKVLNSGELTAQNNEDVRTLLLAALAMEPDNIEALSLLKENIRGEEKLANDALTAYDIAAAKKHIATIEKHSPDSANLAHLTQWLASTETAVNESSSKLQQASALIEENELDPESRRSAKAHRQALEDAYLLIAEAEKGTPQSPGVQQSKQNLESEYIQGVEQLLANDKTKDAKLLFDQMSEQMPDSSNIGILSNRIEKVLESQKPKTRVISSF